MRDAVGSLQQFKRLGRPLIVNAVREYDIFEREKRVATCIHEVRVLRRAQNRIDLSLGSEGVGERYSESGEQTLEFKVVELVQ
jgi:hypothetical protein